ncbi:hypothetical protein MNBD_ALPHA12-2152 [hydrothermal vent metagenome]|uniref:Uncharacterized protein n=1 Tax=hydrothermal vent metagenome TaxID=652676 RepID=A0A3B0TE34_9ZZZZ
MGAKLAKSHGHSKCEVISTQNTPTYFVAGMFHAKTVALKTEKIDTRSIGLRRKNSGGAGFDYPVFIGAATDLKQGLKTPGIDGRERFFSVSE